MWTFVLGWLPINSGCGLWPGYVRHMEQLCRQQTMPRPGNDEIRMVEQILKFVFTKEHISFYNRSPLGEETCLFSVYIFRKTVLHPYSISRVVTTFFEGEISRSLPTKFKKYKKIRENRKVKYSKFREYKYCMSEIRNKISDL